jgi:hypothetical protein
VLSRACRSRHGNAMAGSGTNATALPPPIRSRKVCCGRGVGPVSPISGEAGREPQRSNRSLPGHADHHSAGVGVTRRTDPGHGSRGAPFSHLQPDDPRLDSVSRGGRSQDSDVGC